MTGGARRLDEVVASTTEGVDGTEAQAGSSQTGTDADATTSGIAVQSGNENPQAAR